jgi:O-antigen/teichoic acid export membrane protein
VWVFVSSVIAFALVRGGDLAIATLLPVATLGYYQLASTFAMLPATELAPVITGVTFPVYSRLQGDPARLRAAFLESFSLIAAGVLFLTGAIVAVSHDAVLFLLGPTWSATSSLMPWLAIWAACRALGAGNSSLFQAIGRPALATVFQAVMLAMLAVGAYPVTQRWGVDGLVVLMAGIGIVVQLLRYPLLSSVLQLPRFALYARTLVPASAASCAAALAYVTRRWMPDVHVALRCVAALLVFSAGYVVVLLGWRRVTACEAVDAVVRWISPRLRRKELET